MNAPDRHPWRTWLRFLTLCIATLAAACAHVTLVPPYDEQIDTGLTTLYADTSGFIERMIATAGTPAGTYAANGDFYTSATARVDALIVRAQAHRVLNDCPSTAIVARAFDRAALPAEVKGRIGSLPKDDCQVVLLGMVKDGYRDMADLHRLRGAGGFPPEARGQLDTAIGAMLRAAITVEIAKRASAGEQRK